MKVASGVLALAMAAGAANAVVLYSTDFESPTFVAGPVNGQNGWVQLVSAGTTDTQNVVVDAVNSHAGTQHVRLLGTAWGSSTSARFNATWPDNTLTPAQLAVNPIVRSGVWARIDSTTGRNSQAGLEFYGNDGVIGPGGVFCGALSLYTSGVTGAATGTLGVAVFSFSSGILFGGLSFNTWYHLEMEADYSGHTMKYFLNGADITPNFVLAGGVPDLDATANEFNDADLVSYRRSGTPLAGSAGTHRYDDYYVENLPTPGALGLLGLAGIVAARRRRA